MSRDSDRVETKVADSTPDGDVGRAIARLTSLHDGDLGVVDIVACGGRAIPALRGILFDREPSGLYETRRRAVDALAQLHAYDVLIDYLKTRREIADPLEQSGDDAVINAVARAAAGAHAPGARAPLLELARQRPLAGVVEALGRLRCIEALPFFIRALAEDFSRPAAETALRALGSEAGGHLLESAKRRSPPDERESVSRKRQRRSALGLYAELRSVPAADWAALSDLMGDDDPEIAAIACRSCLTSADDATKFAAVRRLIDLLARADWLLTQQIEDWLVDHFHEARNFIGDALLHTVTGAYRQSPAEARTVRTLFRVVARAGSVAGGRR